MMSKTSDSSPSNTHFKRSVSSAFVRALMSLVDGLTGTTCFLSAFLFIDTFPYQHAVEDTSATLRVRTPKTCCVGELASCEDRNRFAECPCVVWTLRTFPVLSAEASNVLLMPLHNSPAR